MHSKQNNSFYGLAMKQVCLEKNHISWGFFFNDLQCVCALKLSCLSGKVTRVSDIWVYSKENVKHRLYISRELFQSLCKPGIKSWITIAVNADAWKLESNLTILHLYV